MISNQFKNATNMLSRVRTEIPNCNVTLFKMEKVFDPESKKTTLKRIRAKSFPARISFKSSPPNEYAGIQEMQQQQIVLFTSVENRLPSGAYIEVEFLNSKEVKYFSVGGVAKEYFSHLEIELKLENEVPNDSI